MAELVQSGRVVDLAILVLLLEGTALALLRRRTGAGVPLPQLLTFLLSGLALLLAMRAGLAGAPWQVTCAALGAALLAHAADLALRWRRG